ncbi:MAG TPA: alpha/beta fold hydrolase [Beutenbergiaceae bacterium]|nr:alpha/beta fold hydrolase [Beutenbergiaceae bacterium]
MTTDEFSERPIPSVLLVHGIRSSRTMWRGQVEYLESLGASVIAIDLPGHGQLMDQEFTLEECVRVLDEAFARLPDGPKVAVGLSLGSYMVLHWAARTATGPDAVLAASGAVQPRGVGLGAYRAAAGVIGLLPDRGQGLNDVMAKLFLTEQAVQDTAAGGVALDVMGPALNAIGQVDPIADLGRIAVPVWLVNGAWDHFRIEQRLFWRSVNRGRLIVVPKAGHLVSLEAPATFNAVLTVLLDRVADGVA